MSNVILQREIKPNFFIIGAAKAATTSLASLLAAHPQAAIVEGKEVHFFSVEQNYRQGMAFYLSLFAHCRHARAIGDASTSYSRIRYHPRVVERIKRHLPQAKIIYMVRHPLERMESAYVEHLATPGSSVPKSINDAVVQIPMIVDSSRYWEVYQAYLQHFSEQNIKVVWFEEYVRDVAGVFADVCRFLQIDDTCGPDLTAERDNSRAAVLAQARAAGKEAAVDSLVWESSRRRRVIDSIREDNLRFLAYFGKPADYWGDLYY